jgi:hypothetical protein
LGGLKGRGGRRRMKEKEFSVTAVDR